MVHIQVRGGLIQGQHPTVCRETFGESDSDEDTSEDLLSCTATTSHIQFSLICGNARGQSMVGSSSASEDLLLTMTESIIFGGISG